jgi:rubrerythrin
MNPTSATPATSVTIKNLEAAFAGESMAHIKYRYFAKIARAAGDSRGL